MSTKSFYDLDYIIELNEKRLEQYTSAYQKVLERLTNIILIYSAITIFLVPIFSRWVFGWDKTLAFIYLLCSLCGFVFNICLFYNKVSNSCRDRVFTNAKKILRRIQNYLRFTEFFNQEKITTYNIALLKCRLTNHQPAFVFNCILSELPNRRNDMDGTSASPFLLAPTFSQHSNSL